MKIVQYLGWVLKQGLRMFFYQRSDHVFAFMFGGFLLVSRDEILLCLIFAKEGFG